MRNLIYQYWVGDLEPCAAVGKVKMEKYARQIGVEYRFDHNPTFIGDMLEGTEDCVSHFSALRPVFDEEFHQYDNVLYVDCDIFPVDMIEDNIFDNPIRDMLICEETHMPELRERMGGFKDVEWNRRVENIYNVKMPKDRLGRYKVYNSGLVIYSQAGMIKAKKNFVNMRKWVHTFIGFKKFLYYRDQAYVHAMLQVAKMDWDVLSSDWNSQIHWEPYTKMDARGRRPVIDMRRPSTKFVHVQLTGSGDWNEQMLYEATNKQPKDWIHI